ncbi:MAG: hypothetical protein B7Y81_04255 [Caulobacter sp. 32-67-35]|nr:MAG: hypothetical protein B7Y81_04255 [Caulobacter sp. 32-67-35]
MSAQIIQFTRPTPPPIEAPEPTETEVLIALVGTIIDAMDRDVRRSFMRQFQKSFDGAKSPEQAAAVRKAARIMCAPVMGRAN